MGVAFRVADNTSMCLKSPATEGIEKLNIFLNFVDKFRHT